MQAISNHIRYAVVTLTVVVIAIALVTLQHGFTLVGDAAATPAVSVGTALLAHGTQNVQ